ncbi:MAG TPA: TIGR02757 family protein [Puia sp.]|jgi:uncharacterized protein (TIGR02757 family)|nr:TIGR02757 family protein [Puia sp.]
MKAFPNKKKLQDFLEKKVLEYNDPSFIATDPVSVPHRFSKKQDIEIAGLFSSIFAWGNRTTIIQKSNELMLAMDDDPFNFIMNHHTTDLKRFLKFKHRTFNATDLLYFIHFLQTHYRISDTLETAFLTEPLSEERIKKPSAVIIHTEKIKKKKSDENISSENEFIKKALSVFYNRFFSLENAPYRTQKHIATPEKNSACKRLNMYLRWMVRKDNRGVDFGIWKKISAADLICPVDLHVSRVARGFGLINRKQTDWETAMELTWALRDMDKKDPVKYDFALFGLGVMEKY